jgi:hypothetical protein
MGKAEIQIGTPTEAQIGLLPKKYEEFHQSLDTKELKDELREIRKTGDMERLSQKECEIARLIHGKATSFSMGQSLISEILLDEIGIKYLITKNSKGKIQPPLIITSNDTIELLNFKLTDDNIKTPKNENRPITIGDIIAFAKSKKPKTDSLTFSFGNSIRTISKPEKKPKIPLLLALAQLLNQESYHNQSIIICSKLLKLSPKNNTNYDNLDDLLETLGQHKLEIKVFEEFISLIKDSDDERMKSLVLKAESTIVFLKGIDSVNEIINSRYYSDGQRSKRIKDIDDPN